MTLIESFAAASAVFIVAGLVKGVIGLGLPTLSMAMLALWMSPAEAAALLILPSFVTNVWQLQPWRTLTSALRRLWPLQLGIAVGTLGGGALFGAPAGAWTQVLLGAALVAYAAWGLAGMALSVPPAQERRLGPLMGVLTGVVTALTGVFVLPAVPYLQALGLQRSALMQAMGISFTTATVALAVGLAGHGAYSVVDAGLSAGLLLPTLAGMTLGQWLRERLPVPVFKQLFFIGLGLLGAYMLVAA